MIAPPTIAATKTPEPASVSGPRPSIDKVKILGNITELKNPIARMVQTANEPRLSIEVVMSAKATIAAKPSTVPVLTFWSTLDPTKRPSIAPPQ
jgi:hypothetical protein